jgi:cellobiose epimerase
LSPAFLFRCVMAFNREVKMYIRQHVISVVFIAVLSLALSACSRQKEDEPKTPLSDAALADEFEFYLTAKHLVKWYPAILDTVNGGFLTNLSATWEPIPPHPKMIVSQARDVWTACKAAKRFPLDPRYRQAADHGFLFLRDQMWDAQYGGFFLYLPQKGDADNPKYRVKTAYGNAFAIYALAAYVELTGSEEALQLAQKAFGWLELHSHDAVYGGYFNDITREGSSFTDEKFDVTSFPIPRKEIVWKDYNSSIHLLEAFAELYSVWPDPLVRERLNEMLHIIRDTITTPKGYLGLYFERDWKPVCFRDSTRAVLNKNIQFDHVSFGHDIETGYLLLEASKRLGLVNDSLTNRIAKKLVDHTLANGFDVDYSGIVDMGYYYDLQKPVAILRKNKAWWCQAEGLNALLLFSQLYPEEKQYRQAFYKLWEYVKQYIIDNQNGGWYNAGIDIEPEQKFAQKAHEWKSCYHDGRAMMNCVDMLRGKSIL